MLHILGLLYLFVWLPQFRYRYESRPIFWAMTAVDAIAALLFLIPTSSPGPATFAFLPAAVCALMPVNSFVSGTPVIFPEDCK